VNATIGFADDIPSILQELVLECLQEEITSDHFLCRLQAFLSLLKVKFGIEVDEEGGDGIRILILLGLN